MAKITKLKTKREHVDLVLSSIAKLRYERKYTDVTILCGDTELSAHKLILHVGSPYFRRIFSSENEFARQSVVEVDGMDPEVFDDVIGFIYTGCLKTWYEEQFYRLKSILQVAMFLELHGLVKFCWSEVVKTLAVDDFLEQWETAEAYSNADVANQIAVFVGINLRDVVQTSDFLQLNCGQVKKVVLLSRSDEGNRSSDWLMKAILEWVKFNEEERKDDLALLVDLVDINLLSGSYLAHLLNSEPLLTDEDNNFNQLFHLATARLVDMEKKYYERKLFASIGKKNGHDVIVLYDFDKRAWCAPTLLPMVVTSGTSVIALSGWLYFIGGSETVKLGSVSACKFYPPTSSVVSVSNMEVATSQAGTGVLHDMIYVVGGVSDNEAVHRVQRYNPEDDKWNCVSPTNKPHSLPSVVVLYDEMYVVGSYCCPVVESYDWTCDQWTEITQIPLPLTEQWPRATAHQDKLWVWRDLNEQKFLVFDPLMNQWTERDFGNGPVSVYGMWSTCTSVQQLDFMLVSASGLTYYTYYSSTGDWVKLPPCPATDCYYWQSVIIS